jgi:hypothetical protein
MGPFTAFKRGQHPSVLEGQMSASPHLKGLSQQIGAICRFEKLRADIYCPLCDLDLGCLECTNQ